MMVSTDIGVPYRWPLASGRRLAATKSPKRVPALWACLTSRRTDDADFEEE